MKAKKVLQRKPDEKQLLLDLIKETILMFLAEAEEFDLSKQGMKLYFDPNQKLVTVQSLQPNMSREMRLLPALLKQDLEIKQISTAKPGEILIKLGNIDPNLIRDKLQNLDFSKKK